MSDQCKNCTLRGNMKNCRQTPCNIKESWFAIEIEKAAQDEINRLDAQKIELEGQVAMLSDSLTMLVNNTRLGCSPAFIDKLCNQAEQAISATAQTAEQYKRRVQAEALEEAAVNHETWHGFDKHGTSEFLRYMASELRNSANQAEGKGEK